MALLQLNLMPSNKELRMFAGVWFPSMGAMVSLFLLRKLHSPAAALAAAILVLTLSLCGLAAPGVIRPVYLVLIRLTFPIGWVSSHLILLAAYYLVITPIGFLIRLAHDPMNRSFDRSSGSYWVAREQPDRRSYFRQS